MFRLIVQQLNFLVTQKLASPQIECQRRTDDFITANASLYPGPTSPSTGVSKRWKPKTTFGPASRSILAQTESQTREKSRPAKLLRKNRPRPPIQTRPGRS